MTIPPFNDGWHKEALDAASQEGDSDGYQFGFAAADPDGQHFAYARLRQDQAEDLFFSLGHSLAIARGNVVGEGPQAAVAPSGDETPAPPLTPEATPDPASEPAQHETEGVAVVDPPQAKTSS